MQTHQTEVMTQILAKVSIKYKMHLKTIQKYLTNRLKKNVFVLYLPT